LMQKHWKTVLIYIIITIIQSWIISTYYAQKYTRGAAKLSSSGSVQQTPPEPPAQSRIRFDDLAILKEKVTSDINFPPSPVSVTMKVIQSTNDFVRVEVSFVGSDTTKLYASDVVLRVPSGSVSSAEVEAGAAFPKYLRSTFDGSTIVITGGAEIQDNTIVFGQPNRVFATLVLKKKSQATPVSLTLDTTNTVIYYQTQDMLDGKNSTSTLKI